MSWTVMVCVAEGCCRSSVAVKVRDGGCRSIAGSRLARHFDGHLTAVVDAVASSIGISSSTRRCSRQGRR